jgi:drug/metabolite transporter, DME family
VTGVPDRGDRRSSVPSARGATRFERGRSRIGLLQVCAAGVLWGTGGLAVTVLHRRDGLGVLTVSAWRMLLATVALIGCAVVTRRWTLVRATMREQPVLAVVMGCCTAAFQGLFFVSVLEVGVSVATVVTMGLAPVLSATWEHLRARTRPSARQTGVLATALAGLVLICATAGHGSAGPGGSPYLGLLSAVAAGATYAATTVLGHAAAQQSDPVALTTCTTTIGALVLVPVLPVTAIGDHPLLGTSPGSLGLLAYLGIATMALAYFLLYAGLRTTSGSAATVATLLEPVSAAVLATAFLGERLPWPALLGGALILVAVAALRPTEEHLVPA